LPMTSFPALLLVNTSNTSLITSIVNEDQGIYLNIMHASHSKIPVMKLLTNKEMGGATWLISVEMDTIHVMSRFAEAISLHQDELLQTLLDTDQSTGVAYSIFVPLLWACAVRKHIAPEMGEPVFIVPGVAHSVITQNIAVRTIGAIMEILEIEGPAPRHIFQLSSRQIATSLSSEDTSANPFFFVHNNLCDSYYNPDQSYTKCPTPFGGTLLSAYTSTHLREIKMSPTEHTMLASSNLLQHHLRVHVDMLSLSSDFLCPQNMLMQRVRLKKGPNVLVFVRCQICTDTQFWNIDRCQECDTNTNACEVYSWTSDLTCELSRSNP